MHDYVGWQRQRDVSIDEPAVMLTAQSPEATAALALPFRELKAARARQTRRHGRDWLIHRILLVADILGLSLAFLLAQLLFVPSADVRDVIPAPTEALVFILSVPVWVLAGMFGGLYARDHERTDHSTVDDFKGVFAMVTIGAWAFFAAAWLSNAVEPNPPRMVAFWLMAIGSVVTLRALGRMAARRSSMYVQNAIIVGAGDVGQLIARKLKQHPEYGIHLVGFADANPKQPRADLGDLVILGDLGDLPELVHRHQVERVVIAYSNSSHDELLALVHQLKAMSIHIDLVPRLFNAIGPRVEMHMVEALPLIGLPPTRLRPFDRAAKRGIDLLVSAVALLLTAPLFCYIAWRIKRDSPGPVFFRQVRLGLNMKEFTALKFRTMNVGVDTDVHREYIRSTMTSDATGSVDGRYKLNREGEITRFGRWLRETSLDELPQLINVLRGEMSLVGPRPCIPYEIEGFAPQHFERFLVMPGITGLWQVSARARASFGEALEMDVAYARSWSLGLDLRLLFRTPVALWRQAEAKATA